MTYALSVAPANCTVLGMSKGHNCNTQLPYRQNIGEMLGIYKHFISLEDNKRILVKYSMILKYDKPIV